MRILRTWLIPMLLLTGCTDFPDLDARISPEARGAAFPRLVPVGEITGRRALARTTAENGERLAARAAALRARARLLRGIRIDAETRIRISPTLNRLGG